MKMLLRDTDINDDDVVENDHDHHLRYHPRCHTHSNPGSFRRVVVATVSAAASTFCCGRDDIRHSYLSIRALFTYSVPCRL